MGPMKITIFALALICNSVLGKGLADLIKQRDSLQVVADSVDRFRSRIITSINSQEQFLILTEDAPLFDTSKTRQGKILANMKAGDSAFLWDESNSVQYVVDFKGMRGYVLKKSARNRGQEKVDSMQKEFSRNEILVNEFEVRIPALDKQISVTRLKSKYKRKYIDLILAKQIQIGMTSSMVLESWGEPGNKNKSVGSWGIHEQWIYEGEYLYFENGVLKSYQTSE